jgi:hypothetical protein
MRASAARRQAAPGGAHGPRHKSATPPSARWDFHPKQRPARRTGTSVVATEEVAEAAQGLLARPAERLEPAGRAIRPGTACASASTGRRNSASAAQERSTTSASTTCAPATPIVRTACVASAVTPGPCAPAPAASIASAPEIAAGAARRRSLPRMLRPKPTTRPRDASTRANAASPRAPAAWTSRGWMPRSSRPARISAHEPAHRTGAEGRTELSQIETVAGTGAMPGMFDTQHETQATNRRRARSYRTFPPLASVESRIGP